MLNKTLIPFIATLFITTTIFGSSVSAAGESPNVTLGSGNGMKSYFVNNSGVLTETLEISVRELNTNKDGIDVKLESYFKNDWAGAAEVDVSYELNALSTYLDYISDSKGVQKSLSYDYDNLETPTKYTAAQIVQPMSNWMKGKDAQNGFFKRYLHEDLDSKGYHELIPKSFNLRTKDKKDDPNVIDNPNVLILDNAARDYNLKIIAVNRSTNESFSKTILLRITTVKPSVLIKQSKPIFEGKNIVFSPDKGTGWFLGETMGVEWKRAVDTDGDNMYYKVYYYYNDINSDNTLGEEHRKLIGILEDYDYVSNFKVRYTIDNPSVIDTVYIRVIACDYNHDCGLPAKSDAFSFNKDGVGNGTGGGTGNGTGGGTGNGTGTGGTAGQPVVYPQPSGKWVNQNINLFLGYSGDAETMGNAAKLYSVTSSNSQAGEFIAIPENNTIELNLNGVWYVHLKYILTDGKTISTVVGPYKIDKSIIGDFTMSLVDDKGANVTGWTNKNLRIKVTKPNSTSLSDYVVEYKLEGHQNEWTEYKSDTVISQEGNYKIFARIRNEAGTTSKELQAQAKIDKTKPDAEKVVLFKREDGNYEMTVKTTEILSGIQKITTNNGLQLTLLDSNNIFINNDIKAVSKPTSVTLVDNAGNISDAIPLLEEPVAAFGNYNASLSTYKEDIKGTITGKGVVTYKIGSKTYICDASPCKFVISDNSSFIISSTVDNRTTSVSYLIDNIDKTPTKVILKGARNSDDETKATFNWNYNLSNGKLICISSLGTIEKQISSSALSLDVTGFDNNVYTCEITGAAFGETLTSNKISLYPDYSKDIINSYDSLPKKEVKINIYLEESQLGDTYYLNTSKNNLDNKTIPIPDYIY